MPSRNVVDFVLLAGLWGASFLAMRIATPEFGPVPLMLMRCGIGALTLLPILMWRGSLKQLRSNALQVGIVGTINSAMPFVLFAAAALVLSTGTLSVLNATAPFWGALIGYIWLHERLTRWQLLGLLIGFVGVYLLVSGRTLETQIGSAKILLAVSMALLATFFYGLAANFTKRFLANSDALANATGSQVSAALVLLIPGVFMWPAVNPTLSSWLAVVALGVFATGFAYLLFFRLIRNLGPTRAITVTFAIPAFGMLWGWLFLGETVSVQMLVGAVVVVIGCALTTRVIALNDVVRRADK